MSETAKVTFETLKAGPSQLQKKKITVKEWGGDFFITEISATDHKGLVPKIQELAKQDESGTVEQSSAGPLAAKWLSHLLEDVDGKKPDETWLMGQSLRLLMDLSKQALEFNGLTEESRKETEKNSTSPESEKSSESQ